VVCLGQIWRAVALRLRPFRLTKVLYWPERKGRRASQCGADDKAALAYFQPMSYTELSMEEETIRAHGTYEMPVWGLFFLGEPHLAIIAYLKSIQLE
jgi:hypothetical protein